MKACNLCKCGFCEGCYYADECPQWEGFGSDVAHVSVNVKAMLCASRHNMPADVRFAIFPQNISDPTDLPLLEMIADNSLREDLGLEDGDAITLYVTGLTVALMVVVNWCRENSVKLTLMHFDRETGKYFKQEVA